MKKQNKGITLIVLLITIIVLLIVAGVAIETLIGESGMLTQLSNAREKNKIAQAKEEVNLAFQTLKLKEQTEKVDREQRDDIVLEELKEVYSRQTPASSVNLAGAKFLVKHRGYDFEVDESKYIALYKGNSFNSKEWDKKACDEKSFIWASDDKNSGEDYHTIIGYSGKITNEQKLIIPSRCHEIRCEYFWNNDEARTFAQTLTQVEIPETVTTIGYHAFTGFQFESIEIPNSVTTIGESAFSYCQKLTNITIPDSVTTIGNGAFQSCYELTDIVIPEYITYVGSYAFEETPWYNNQPDGLIYVGEVAYKYKGEMPENFSIVIKEGTKTLAGDIFAYQWNLTNIEIPDSVIFIGRSAFCSTNLSKIKIPKGVTTIEESTFNSCSNLASVEMSKNITNIGNYAFSDCTSLTSIEIPDSVTSIGERAFACCYNLANISMPKVAYIGTDAFRETAWYNNQTGLIYIGTILYGYSGYMPDNTTIVVQEGTTEIAGGAFEWCTGLKNIEIPDSVKSIGQNAFYGCSNLSSIRIPDGIKTISNYIFNECTSLTNVEIPNSVTKIQYNAFSNCTSLTNIKIPDSVTIMEWGIFENCTSLSNIKIPEGVSRIEGNTFYNCISLKSIIIPDSVTKIDGSSFYNCASLASIEIPKGVTRIEWSTFENCTNLLKIEIPDTLIYAENNAFDGTAWYDSQADGVVYVGKIAYKYKGAMPENTNIVLKEGTAIIANYLFDNQYNLKSIEIPDSLTGIGNYAFSDCTNLSSISISKNTKYIGILAFEGCTNLSSIVIWKNVDEVRSRTFRGWESTQTVNIEAEQVPSGWALDWNDECEAQIIYAYSD